MPEPNRRRQRRRQRDKLTRRLRPLRRLFPPPGRGYQLFDAAALVVFIALCWYVTTEPSDVSTAAIDETVLGILFSPRGWGWGMLVVGTFSTVAAYGRGHRLDAGYYALAFTLGGWASALVLGSLLSLTLGVLEWNDAGKGVGSGLFFAYACRNIIAGLMRRDAEAVECTRCRP